MYPLNSGFMYSGKVTSKPCACSGWVMPREKWGTRISSIPRARRLQPRTMTALLPTSPSFLRLQGERRGAAGGLVFADRLIPWGELTAAADELAGWLARRGVGAGQHVGVTAANEPALVAMLYALWGLGAVPVPLRVR